MRFTFTIKFTDGTEEVTEGYTSEVKDGVLRIRTSASGAYSTTWDNYPTVNIKKWSSR